jgi:hypothetical protein
MVAIALTTRDRSSSVNDARRAAIWLVERALCRQAPVLAAPSIAQYRGWIRRPVPLSRGMLSDVGGSHSAHLSLVEAVVRIGHGRGAGSPNALATAMP